ncbi:YbaN family protein [Chloroflexota bacterium]
MRETATRRLLIVAGTISTGLGIIGIFVPILPTTPFLLLAAACYMRSSERFYRWLISNRLFGSYVRNYIEGRGMPLRIKVLTVLLLWLTIGVTVTFAVHQIAWRIVLVIIAVLVTVHVGLIRPKG